MTPDVRRTWSLGGRIARIVVVSTVAMLLAAAFVAYAVVGAAMRSDLDAALGRDAAAVALAYDGRAEQGPAALSGPTGRVRVQIYTTGGTLLAASDPAFESAAFSLDAGVIRGTPGSWRGTLDGRTWHAATAPFSSGVVAVLADASYVETSLRRVARSLALLGVVLAAVCVPLAWWAARALSRPIRDLAAAVRDRGPDDLASVAVPTSNLEVAQLATAFDDLLARLRDAGDARRRFLAETSHELRTPLTSLRGFVHRARRVAGHTAALDLDDAERIAGDMAHKIDDLLVMARGDARPPLDLHLVEVARDVVAPVAAEFLRVVQKGPPDTLLLGDPQRLRQIVRNLVANAVRSTDPDGSVQVRWTVRGDDVVLAVEDDGPGVPSTVQPTLFEPFARGEAGGTGLGLGVARGWARAHGGDVTLVSSTGRCTVFEVRLPRYVDEEDDRLEGASVPAGEGVRDAAG